MSHQAPLSYWRVHFQLLAVQVLFALLPSLGKKAFIHFAPEVIAFLRISITAVLLGWILFFHHREPLQKRSDVGTFALLAAFGVVGNQLLFLKGLDLTQAVNASLLIATIPLFTLVLAALFRHEKLTLIKLSGVIIAFTGAGLLLNLREFQFRGYTLGNLMIILNALSYSVFLVISKPILKRYRSLTVITWIFICGSFEMIPFAAASMQRMFHSPPPATAFFWPLIIIVFCTFLPYLLNTMSLQVSRSSLVATYTYLQPLLGTALAVIWLHEKVGARFITSGMMIFIGIAFVTLERLGRVFPAPASRVSARTCPPPSSSTP